MLLRKRLTRTDNAPSLDMLAQKIDDMLNVKQMLLA